jgi:hypothetical protein
MADYPRITGTIAPTPRNRISGFLADLLELGAKGYDVGSTLQAGGPITEGRLSTPVSDLLGIPELQRTLNRVSYNEPLTTGTGYTTRLRPDTVSAAMTVAPMVGPAAKAGATGARMTGTALKDLATSDVAYNAAMNAMKRSGVVFNMADDEYKTFGDAVKYKRPKAIEPPHGVRDEKKLDSLVESMKEKGWVGRPILAYDIGRGPEALTGSHRIQAARKAGIDEIPVVMVDNEIGNYIDEAGESISEASYKDADEVSDFLRKFGDKDAADLMMLEHIYQTNK